MAQKISVNLVLGWVASLVILGVTVFTVLWAYGQGEFEFGQAPAGDDTVSTADWVEYRNTDYGFALKIPAAVQVQERSDNFVFSGGESEFQIKIDKANYDLLAKENKEVAVKDYKYLDAASDEQSQLAGRAAGLYKAPEGYCDMGSCTAPYLAYAVVNNKAFFVLILLGDTKVSVFEQAVLGTVEFFEVKTAAVTEDETEDAETESTAPTTPTTPAIEWLTYTNTTYGISFKYPKGANVTEGKINNPSAGDVVYTYGTDFGYPVAQENTLPYMIWSVANNGCHLSLNDFFDANRADLHTGDTINKLYKIGGAANIPAINTVFVQSPQSFGYRTVYFLDNAGRFHAIAWNLRGTSTAPYATFDQLLATVKLL